MEIDPGLCWYAIYTKKQKEHFADLKLLQLEIETFLPLIYCRVRRRNQLRPLFPCYLFARFDATRWLYTINHLEGVNKVVSFNERPIPVEPAILDSLRERMSGRGYLVEEKPLAPGDTVRIQEGLFEGLEGRIEAVRPRDRVVILLNTILSRARVEIHRNRVELLREYTP